MTIPRVFFVLGSAIAVHLLTGCDDNVSNLGEERRAVSSAVQRMGGGGLRATVVHVDTGAKYNRIQLNFRGRKRLDDQSIASLAGLGGIVGIDLSETYVSDDGLHVLSTLPDLEYLQLGDTSITDAGLLTLQDCVSLKRLDIRRFNPSEDTSDILRGFPTLEVVYSKGTNLTSTADLVVNSSDELGPYFKPMQEKEMEN